MSDEIGDTRSDREMFLNDAIESAQAHDLRITIGWTTGIGVGFTLRANDVRIHRGGIVFEYVERGSVKATELWAPIESILNISVLINDPEWKSSLRAGGDQ